LIATSGRVWPAFHWNAQFKQILCGQTVKVLVKCATGHIGVGANLSLRRKSLHGQYIARPMVTFLKAKANAYNTCIAPQAEYCCFRGAGHDTERAGVGPIGRRLSLHSQADL